MPNNARLDAVFVEDGTHLVRGQINISLTIITLDETMAITVSRNGALELCEEARSCAGTVLSCFNKNLFKSFAKWLLFSSESGSMPLKYFNLPALRYAV